MIEKGGNFIDEPDEYLGAVLDEYLRALMNLEKK